MSEAARLAMKTFVMERIKGFDQTTYTTNVFPATPKTNTIVYALMKTVRSAKLSMTSSCIIPLATSEPFLLPKPLSLALTLLDVYIVDFIQPEVDDVRLTYAVAAIKIADVTAVFS